MPEEFLLAHAINTVKPGGRQDNEDAACSLEGSFNGTPIFLLAICDGLGGGGAKTGAVAADYVIGQIRQLWASQVIQKELCVARATLEDDRDAFIDFLFRSFLPDLSDGLCRLAGGQQEDNERKYCTTLSMCIGFGSVLLSACVGDSPILLRPVGDDVLWQRAPRRILSGIVGSYLGPRRFDLEHWTRGLDSELLIDALDLNEYDAILVCSDGVIEGLVDLRNLSSPWPWVKEWKVASSLVQEIWQGAEALDLQTPQDAVEVFLESLLPFASDDVSTAIAIRTGRWTNRIKCSPVPYFAGWRSRRLLATFKSSSGRSLGQCLWQTNDDWLNGYELGDGLRRVRLRWNEVGPEGSPCIDIRADEDTASQLGELPQIWRLLSPGQDLDLLLGTGKGPDSDLIRIALGSSACPAISINRKTGEVISAHGERRVGPIEHALRIARSGRFFPSEEPSRLWLTVELNQGLIVRAEPTFEGTWIQVPWKLSGSNWTRYPVAHVRLGDASPGAMFWTILRLGDVIAHCVSGWNAPDGLGDLRTLAKEIRDADSDDLMRQQPTNRLLQ